MTPPIGRCNTCRSLTISGHPGDYRTCPACGNFALIVRP